MYIYCKLHFCRVIKQRFHCTPLSQNIALFNREIREKVDVQFSEDGVYLDYKTNKYYVFDRNASSGPESDWFTGVNLPMLVS